MTENCWQDELREQIQGARHMAEVSPDLVRRALIHMDAAVREVSRLEAERTADRARLRALEEENSLLRMRVEADRVEGHADARRERERADLAEEEVARLREAASAASDSLRWRSESWAKQIQATLESALHGQDTEVGR